MALTRDSTPNSFSTRMEMVCFGNALMTWTPGEAKTFPSRLARGRAGTPNSRLVTAGNWGRGSGPGGSFRAMTTVVVEIARDLVFLGELLFLKLAAVKLFFRGQVRTGRQLVY